MRIRPTRRFQHFLLATAATFQDVFILRDDSDLPSVTTFGHRLYDCSYSPVRCLMYDTYS
jgi:hypothetical protein